MKLDHDTEQQERKTPRTDRETYTVTARDIGFKAVGVELAKMLERELSMEREQIAKLECDGPIIKYGIEIQTGPNDRPIGGLKQRFISMREALNEAEQAAGIEANRAERAEKQLATAQKAFREIAEIVIEGKHLNISRDIILTTSPKVMP